MPVINHNVINRQPRFVLVTWEGLGDEDTGDPFLHSGNWDLESVQAKGTFAGSSVTIQGSNDGGVTWSDVGAY